LIDLCSKCSIETVVVLSFRIPAARNTFAIIA
jgi:hypothetical protein